MIKIGIDGGPLKSADSVRGIGVYARELINSLEEVNSKNKSEVKVEVVDVSNTNLSDYNIIHLTRFNPFKISVPFFKPRETKFILTIYDLIPLIYPKHYPPGIRGWIKWQLNKLLIRLRVDAIITISETSKKDICRFTGINPKKVFVTYLAPRKVFKKLNIPSYPSLPKKFVLYVGDVNFNKNIPNLIKACELASIQLVIAGKQAMEVEKMDFDHPELSHLKNVDWRKVMRLGFVSDEDLVKIYNLATVYIQPSFYEGFGLPLLEALECGTPIAVSKNQCHVEILGSDFSFFDPKSVEEIARAIENPNKGKEVCRSYDWGKTAILTMDVYRKILGI